MVCPQCHKPYTHLGSVAFRSDGEAAAGFFGRVVDYRFLSAGTANRERVEQLRWGDEFVIIVSGVLIGLAVCREIRDAQLCEVKQGAGAEKLRKAKVDHSHRGTREENDYGKYIDVVSTSNLSTTSGSRSLNLILFC